MTDRLLLIEDEKTLRRQLVELLETHLFEVDACVDGVEGVHMGESFNYDIAVIDLGLPRLPGLEVVKRLRLCGKDFPILILTARGDWTDKVDGLAAGADDYLVKPFHVQELLARLKALTRRARGQLRTELSAGPIKMDTRSKGVEVAGAAMDLTAYEYNLLHYLMLRPNEVISKTELTEHLYHQDFDRDSNVIEVFVGRLRRKLDPGNLLHPIATVRGQGYRLNCP
ncbi:MAG: response regulator transcription factor [Pseudomonadota bacterium]|jgi:two-component system response regulator PhoP|nr:response regulator transcription factor [Pseudomonadota bacterium]MEC8820972.1 response regulator transcription factor [Pseudomonadota bacterium]